MLFKTVQRSRSIISDQVLKAVAAAAVAAADQQSSVVIQKSGHATESVHPAVAGRSFGRSVSSVAGYLPLDVYQCFDRCVERHTIAIGLSVQSRS
jgi:hypothetical protein